MPFRIAVMLIWEIMACIGAAILPFWGLLLLLFITFTRPQDDRPNLAELRIPMALTVSLLVGTAARMAIKRERIQWTIRRLLLFAAFLFLMFLSAAFNWTPEASYHLEEFFTVATVCGLILIWVDSEPKCHLLVGTFLAAGLYLFQLAMRSPSWLRTDLGPITFDRLNLGKKNINFGNTNFLAIFMVVLIILALAWMIGQKRWILKPVLLAMVPAFIYVFLNAQARAASLAFAAGMLLFWLLQPRKVLMAGLMVAVLIVAVLFAPATYVERLRSIGNYQEDASATTRLQLWDAGLDMIMSNPLLGVGPSNFTRHAPSTPHNAYIQVASEMGILAFLVFLLVVGSGFWAAIRARAVSARFRHIRPFQHSISNGVICALAAICVQGFFTGLAHREFLYFTIALAHCLDSLSAQTAAQLAEPAPSPAGRARTAPWPGLPPFPQPVSRFGTGR